MMTQQPTDADPNPQEPSWAARLDSWARSHALVLVLALAAFFVSTSSTIVKNALDIWQFYTTTIQWRDAEYNKLQSLHGGMNIAKVQELFGQPLFIRKVSLFSKDPYTLPDGLDTNAEHVELTESIYRGRDYWVQTLHRADGPVEMFSVTTCDALFQPHFDTVAGTVTLNETTIATLRTRGATETYAFPGNTSNSFYYAKLIWGNPSLYKTFFFGINDACGREQLDIAFSAPDIKSDRTLYLERFESGAKINTYAETNPHFEFPTSFRQRTQIGADRILVRTLEIKR